MKKLEMECVSKSKGLAKILWLLSGKIHKCEYLTDEKNLLPQQQRITEQFKVIYSPLREVLGQQKKQQLQNKKNSNKKVLKER